ncbi:hypothetical protein KSP39_PZI002030 [Platanthera zijinensis]|uniref:Retrotransposon Copia-like N-terminal domain-containing protein n=1 Tax=Platanthera zijinensis TaxID=2320716 RepID=A0AAP0BZE9_9ASPA
MASLPSVESPVPSKISLDDSLNPFFLHPSDNPGSVLVSQILKGDNYSSWNRAMKMALIGKNKFGFVDGSITSSADNDSLSILSWHHNNNIVSSWLLNLISKDIAANIIYVSSAAEIWSGLQERFQQ